MRRAAAGLVLACVLALPGSADAARVNVTLEVDPDLLSGADGEGRVLLFTPDPYDGGSSVSHFDSSASPSLLMQPGISPALPVGGVDLTRAAMQDLGWRRGAFRGNISYIDVPGTGFDDPQLGAPRKVAFEFALALWQQLLGSPVAVDIEASFRRFDCDETGGTLAAAGPNFAFIDTPGADPGVWHTGPLAEALAGRNLSDANGSQADIDVFFNSEIDNGCLGEGSIFYYGLDDEAAPGEISFVNVTMHELGHGLGFVSLADGETGALFNGSPDVFSRLIFDNRIGESWDRMTNGERRVSAETPGEVVLDGRRTTRAGSGFLRGTDFLRVNRPRKLRGVYEVGTAVFGPPLTAAGVRGDLALVDDGGAQPTFGCEPLVNGDEIAGKIALIDRGECLFVEKVKNAQNAGAIGAVIIHNEPGSPPRLGGSDPTITIPAVRVGQRDGRKLKRRVAR